MTRAYRRVVAAMAAVAAIVLLATLAVPARAGEDPWSRPWSAGDARRAVLKTFDEEGAAAAGALVARLAEPGSTRHRARDVEAARAAFELLPKETGLPAATKVVATLLRADPSDAAGAWTLAQDLRRDVVRRADVTAGESLLRELIAIYPEVPNYRYDLGVLFLDSARRADARVEFEKAFQTAPSSVNPAYRLAEMLEQDGDPRGAVAVYNRILATRPTEFPAHGSKASVLAFTLGEVTEARRVLDDAMRLAAGAPEGAERTRALSDLAERRQIIEQRERNRAAIREVDSRVTTVLGVVVLLAAAAAVSLLAWVSKLRAEQAGDSGDGRGSGSSGGAAA